MFFNNLLWYKGRNVVTLVTRHACLLWLLPLVSGAHGVRFSVNRPLYVILIIAFCERGVNEMEKHKKKLHSNHFSHSIWKKSTKKVKKIHKSKRKKRKGKFLTLYFLDYLLREICQPSLHF